MNLRLRTVVNHALLGLISLLWLSCTRRQSLGDNYSWVIKGSHPLLHEPGTSELHRTENGRDKLITPYFILMFHPIVTNNTILFNAGLSNDAKWFEDPAMFAYVPPGPPVEVTEAILRYYCRKSAKDYQYFAGYYSFEFPDWTNGMIAVTGHCQSPGHEEFIHVSFSTNDLVGLVQDARTKAKPGQYGKMKYLIEDVRKH